MGRGGDGESGATTSAQGSGASLAAPGPARGSPPVAVLNTESARLHAPTEAPITKLTPAARRRLKLGMYLLVRKQKYRITTSGWRQPGAHHRSGDSLKPVQVTLARCSMLHLQGTVAP